MEILKIHATPMRKTGDIDYDAIVKLTESCNGADLRNVCTEAGMFAIRDERDYVVQDDFAKAARKVRPLIARPLTHSGHGVEEAWQADRAERC